MLFKRILPLVAFRDGEKHVLLSKEDLNAAAKRLKRIFEKQIIKIERK